MKRTRQSRKRTTKQSRRRLQRGLESLEPRNLLATLTGLVFDDVNGDGIHDPVLEPGIEGISVYVDLNDNQVLDAGDQSAVTQANGAYTIPAVGGGSRVVRVQPPFRGIQTFPQSLYGTGAPQNPPSAGTTLYELSPSGVVTLRPSNTSGFASGLVRTNDGEFYFLENDNSFYQILQDGDGLEITTALPQEDLLGGLAYDSNADVIYTVGRVDAFSNTYFLYEIDRTDGGARRVGNTPGLQGLLGQTDLTFDWVNNRVIGFDDATDQFFAFDTAGNGQLLATASRAINSEAFAFDGSRYVMFDGSDLSNESYVDIDPDTGAITPTLSSNIELIPRSLTFGARGETPYRLTFANNDTITDLNFGILGERFEGSGEQYFINELLVSPLDGNDSTDQLVEFRGVPGGSIGSGTYFVSIDESAAGPGTISSVFDLQGMVFDDEGFLSFLQGNSTHPSGPGSNVVRSTGAGFGGLPNSLFTSTDTVSNTIPNSGASSYFLIESPVVPVAGDDIDVDNDGIADSDTPFSSWLVMDSFSMHDLNAGTVSYSDLVFLLEETNQPVNVSATAQTLRVEGFGYAARHGDSFGFAPEDWIVGQVVNEAGDGAIPRWGISQNDAVGTVTPPAYMGRNLDHVGDSNFIGAIRGNVVQESTDPDPAIVFGDPAPNVVVLADTNDNQIRDELTFSLLAADEIPGTNIVNALEGVTLTTTDDAGIETEEVLVEANQGGAVFAHGTRGFFNEMNRLNAEFYRPASSVSVEAVSGGPETFVRVDVFDVDGNLLDSSVSGPLLGSSRETVTVSVGDNLIASAIAYSDTMTPGTSGAQNGRIAGFGYSQFEATAVSDAEGFFELENLVPADYIVHYENDILNLPLAGADDLLLPINRYENHIVGPNFAPTTEDRAFVIFENSPPGHVLGRIDGTDPDGGTVEFSLLSGQEHGLAVNSATGDLFVSVTAIDFETTPLLFAQVQVRDEFGASAISNVTIDVLDQNEPPSIITSNFDIREDADNGDTLGQVQASDPDAGADQNLTFTVTGGSGIGIFAVNPNSGLITLPDSSLIDFEVTPQYNLRITVSDGSTPPQQDTDTVVINVLDANDAPTLSDSFFSINENMGGFVGMLMADDPDVGQTHQYSTVGGDGANVFALSTDGEITVRPNSILDFEDTSTYTLQVRAFDNGTPALADIATVTIGVRDVNEAASLVSGSVAIGENASVGENAPAGEVITTLSVDDPENLPENYTIELVQDLGDFAEFEFVPDPDDPSMGQLRVGPNAAFNFEEDRQKTLFFRLVDSEGGPSPQLQYTVDILDENDAPFLIQQDLTVSEAAVPGVEIGRIVAGDFDANDTFTVRLDGGTGQGLFDVAADGAVTVADGVVLQADVIIDPYTLDVTVFDSEGLSGTGTILVRVNDVNEDPVFTGDIELPPIIVGEPFTYVIPADLAVDPEGAEIHWAIFDENFDDSVDENGGLPDWLEFEPSTRTLTGNPAPGDESPLNLIVRAFELGPPVLFTEVPLTITVETPFTNKRDFRDVNDDQAITARDALMVINFIERYGNGSAPNVSPTFPGFVDVNGNLRVTAIDAVIVINGIGTPYMGTIEGEATSAASDTLDDREDAIDAALSDLGDSLLF